MHLRVPRLPVSLLLFATALLVALPAAGIIVYSGVQLRRQALNDASTEVRRLSNTIAAHQQGLLAGAEQLISVLAQLPEVRRRDAARVHELLAGILRLNEQYSNLFIADPTGAVWAQALDQPPFAAGDRRYFRQAVASGRLSSGEYLIGRSSGKPTLTFARAYRDAHGELAGVICVGFDPTQYRRFLPVAGAGGMSYLLLDHRGVVIARSSDEARFVGREFPRDLFEDARTAPDGTVAVVASMAGDERLVARRRLQLPGEDRPYLFVLTGVPTAALRAGIDRAVLRDVALLLVFVFAAASLAWLLGERSIAAPLRRLENATRRIAGGDWGVRVSGTPGPREIGALAGTFDDMARQLEERERARHHSEQLYLQSQKMESVGRLAGGIAHDFNNLLTVINGHTALLRETLAERPDVVEDLDVIRTAGESAGSLTRQLLAFSRKQLLKPRVVDLNELLAGTDRMLRRVLGEDVHLVTRLAPGLWPIRADPGQIEQVVMNLAVNARDAMPRGGTLTIETANVVVPPAAGAGPRSAGDDEHVLLAVSDTGEGMDAATLERIFEPFFTTKQDRGTGLGLSTVYGIVTQSGGRVAVESAPGRGSVFRVHFPREREVVTRPPGEERPILELGARTILVAEDSDPVRALMRDVLELRGHRVLTARNGEEALAVAARHAGPIDLLLADVVMPVLGGRELAERLSATRPELRVLFVTGYTDDRILAEGLLEHRIDLLEKPFTPDVLLWKIGEVLGRRSPPLAG